MADAATALAGGGGAIDALAGTGASTPSVISGQEADRALAKKIFKEEGDLTAQETELVGTEMASQDAHRAKTAEERAALASRMPVPEKPTSQPNFKETSPQQAWGSAAMMFAMFGSLLTKTPMNAALNAAAGALKAFHQNDLDTYNREFQKWQTESNNAAKMFEYEDRAYQRVLAEFDRREKETDAEGEHRIRDIETHIRALATSFKDQTRLLMLDQGGLRDVEKSLQDQRSWMNQMQRTQIQLEKEAPNHAAWIAAQSDPEYQAIQRDIKNNVRGGAGRLTEYIRTHIPGMAQQVDRQLDTAINSQVSQLQKSDVAKTYHYFKAQLPQVDEAETYLDHYGTLDPGHTAILKDAFNKGATHGQAVRSFMTNMLKQGTPYAQQAEQALAMFDQHGAAISKEQAKLLIHIVKDYNNAAARDYAQMIEGHARMMDSEFGPGKGDIIRENAEPDLDLSKYNNPKPPAKTSEGGYPKPPEKAIEALKLHPDKKALFDQHYGPGAAERALGEGGTTGAGQSGNFPASE